MDPRRRGVAAVVLCGVAALTPGGVGGVLVTAAEAPPAAGVLVEDYAYQPATVTVAAGGTVTWTLGSDPEQHTVTPQRAGAFEDSGQLFEGDTYAVTFARPGPVEYFCRLHPTMTGTVMVVAAPSPTPTNVATARPTQSARAGTATPLQSPADAATPGTVPLPPPGEPGAIALPLAIAAAFAVAIVVGLHRLRRGRS